MSLSDHADFVAMIRLIAREEAHRAHDGGSVIAEDGIIADGSYNPKDGTVSVWLSESASILTDGTEQPLLRQGIQLLTPIHGQQAGPVGGERVILIRRHSGFLAVLEHGEDDSPGALAGEHHYLHKSGSYQKFLNTGNIASHANAQHQVTAGTIASVLAPEVQIGPSGGPFLNVGSGGPGSGYALVRVFELNALVNTVNALITKFNVHTHMNVQGGSDMSGPTANTATSAATATGATNATAG